jgi:hypothetical protein
MNEKALLTPAVGPAFPPSRSVKKTGGGIGGGDEHELANLE